VAQREEVEQRLSIKMEKAKEHQEKEKKRMKREHLMERDKTQKRILRCKLTNLLLRFTPFLCGDYKWKQDKVQAIREKCYNSKVTQPSRKLPNLPSLTSEGGFMSPDEVLVSFFTEQELRMVNYMHKLIRSKRIPTITSLTPSTQTPLASLITLI